MKTPLSAPQRYAAPSIALHWLMAAVIILLLIIGAFMDDLVPPQKLQVILLHKSLGVTVLGLLALRLLFRITNPAPRLAEETPRWQVLFAHGAHLALYGLMLLIPLSGWVMSDAKGYHPALFGADILPVLVAPNEALSHLAKEVHEVGATLLWVLLGLHVLAAAWHHRVKKDDILRRMVPLWLARRLPVVALLAAVPLGGLWAASAPPLWTVIPASSHLNWKAQMDGAVIQGAFKDWAAQIVFDPNQLEQSSITVKVKLGSVSSNDAQRDHILQSIDFFNVEATPEAVFSSTNIKAVSTGFVAIGNLTLGGVTKPFAIPFQTQLSADGKHVRADASIRLSRLAFNIGKGQWKGSSSLADVINLDILVTAERP